MMQTPDRPTPISQFALVPWAVLGAFPWRLWRKVEPTHTDGIAAWVRSTFVELAIDPHGHSRQFCAPNGVVLAFSEEFVTNIRVDDTRKAAVVPWEPNGSAQFVSVISLDECEAGAALRNTPQPATVTGFCTRIA